MTVGDVVVVAVNRLGDSGSGMLGISHVKRKKRLKISAVAVAAIRQPC